MNRIQSALLLATIVVLAGGQQADPPAETVPGSAILYFEPPRSRSAALSNKRESFFNRDIKNILSSPAAKSTLFAIGSLQGFVVSNASHAELSKLRNSVEELQGVFAPDYVYTIRLPYATSDVSDKEVSAQTVCNSNTPCSRRQFPPLNSQQLDLLNLHGDEGYYCSPRESKAKMNVFILDTGIETSHSDFAGLEVNTYDAATAANKRQWTPYVDMNGHGTHVAGIIGSKTFGVTPNVILHSVKVLNDAGSGSSSTILNGLNILKNWLNSNPSKKATVNMSLSGNRDAVIERALAAVANAYGKQVVIVVAAGNEDVLACRRNLPSVNEVIAVGSISSKLVESSFSNYGSCVDIFAIGEKVKSTFLNNKFAVKTGTSMASPVVAGVISQYWVENPQKVGTEIRDMILSGEDSDLHASGLLVLSEGSPDKLVRYTCKGECSSCTTTSTTTTTTPRTTTKVTKTTQTTTRRMVAVTTPRSTTAPPARTTTTTPPRTTTTTPPRAAMTPPRTTTTAPTRTTKRATITDKNLPTPTASTRNPRG